MLERAEEMMDKHYENNSKVVINRNYHFELSVKTKFVDPVKPDQDFYSEKLCGNKTWGTRQTSTVTSPKTEDEEELRTGRWERRGGRGVTEEEEEEEAAPPRFHLLIFWFVFPGVFLKLAAVIDQLRTEGRGDDDV